MTTVLRLDLEAEPPVPALLDAPCTVEAFIPIDRVGTDVEGAATDAPRFYGWELDVVSHLDESRTRELIERLNNPDAYQTSCTLCSGPTVLVRICCGEWTGDFIIDPSDAVSRIWTSGGEPPFEHLPLSLVGQTALRTWLEEAFPDRSFGCPEDNGHSAEK